MPHYYEPTQHQVRRATDDQCRLDLLKILLHTQGFVDGWAITPQTRHLFALTRGFDMWIREGRGVGMLSGRMRTWLARDIAPMACRTRLFTRPMCYVPCRNHAWVGNLVAPWFAAGTPLDCFVGEVSEETGRLKWMAGRGVR